MLELKAISKAYDIDEYKINALNNISIAFRPSEFVAILGPSGCGKTTLLNIIGGLDKYSEGDLIIDGTSTTSFSDKDWDSYRNHSIGFVFQNYNLIPHQTVLANVELSLTISGIDKAERKQRAINVLELVGLADQLSKKPNQLSGGQMQRVAIARALINNPDILLADEPTGALDSETSIQVMDILKEISKEKLVIMVTHNPELATQYATRIVQMKDGSLTDDSSPFTTQKNNEKKIAFKHVSMSPKTAFSLSLNNLILKKTRTFMTSFAGSIGIIGIALILSLSNGVNAYIDRVQEDTLTAYPITIDAESTDTLGLMTSMMELTADKEPHDDDKVYSNTVLYDVFNKAHGTSFSQNNLKDFKKFLDTDERINEFATDIQYMYDSPMPIYTEDVNGKIIKTDMAETISNAYGGQSDMLAGTYNTILSQIQIWDELMYDSEGNISQVEKNQYELIYGQWPDKYNEVVLIVNKNNGIADLLLYAMGLKDTSTLPYILSKAIAGEPIEYTEIDSWSYEEICNKEFKLILPTEHYLYNETDNTYSDVSLTDAGLEYLYNNDDIGVPLKISGIIRINSDVTRTSVFSMGYTHKLTEYVLNSVEKDQLIQAQLANKDTNILTGLPFSEDSSTSKTDDEKATSIKEYIASLGNTTDDLSLKAEIYTYMKSLPDAEYLSNTVEDTIDTLDRSTIEGLVAATYAEKMGVDTSLVEKFIASMTDEELYTQVSNYLSEKVIKEYAANIKEQLSVYSADELAMFLVSEEFANEKLVAAFDKFTPEIFSASSYEDSLKALGYITKDCPSKINIYAESFDAKGEITDIIKEYNENVSDENKITYTDYVALLMSSMTEIISGVSSLLIAFVGIALVVSSIMIGIITYISVLERTREIGILRAIGASKGDIANVFNAETLLIGFTAGLIGIVFTVIVNIPITFIIRHLTGLAVTASLPVMGGIILVLISMLLTFIAGLIPSRIAAKMNPVVALRSE